MNKVLVVNELYASDHLVCQHQHSLHSEPTTAEVEEIFQRGPQQVHHQNVVLLLLTKPSVITEKLDIYQVPYNIRNKKITNMSAIICKRG